MRQLLLGTAFSFGMLALAFWPLERAFPARAGQRLFRSAWGVDLLFFLGQYLLWGPLVVLGLASLQEFFRPEALAWLRDAVSLQPTWLQVVETVVLADLGVYWWHRLCHQVDWLWRFHAVHHSAEHLDWLAAHREHPLDGLTTQLVCNLPAFLLGIPLGPLAMVVAFRSIWGAFIHSNARLPLGPLGFLFGAPELHHWHHARVEQTRHNFANLAPYMDWIFGTYHRPEGEERWALGLTEPFPRGYLGQLLSPLRALVLPVRGTHPAAPATGRGEPQAADHA
ncbi:sterol desaturase family protein [Hyalangium minutum]|uniref:sterol desaturase family protein n=1 Tax=Hyalangium minutum TaxID=394096 RepID=UPI0007C769D7|nr:sterol desaturase family protein [Hyalangium minutum]